jgi:hypothetical protein
LAKLAASKHQRHESAVKLKSKSSKSAAQVDPNFTVHSLFSQLAEPCPNADLDAVATVLLLLEAPQ